MERTIVELERLATGAHAQGDATGPRSRDLRDAV
jgi:hypothetical protein